MGTVFAALEQDVHRNEEKKAAARIKAVVQITP
jgi:hypothetical protein